MEKKNLSFFKRIIRKKRTWVLLVLILAVSSYFIFRTNDNSKNVVSDTAKYTDLKQTILATGQATSKTDLNLSFNSSGTVRSLRVSVGDKVSTGQILANIDQGAQLASLTQARGALAAAQARLKKTLEGASSEDISLAQVNLDQTRLTQATLVKNAYHNLLNSTPEALPEGGVSDYIAPTISGSYNGDVEGDIKITIYYTGSGSSFLVSGLTSGVGVVTTTTSQPIGNSGLYIKFPSISNSVTNWVIKIPNKKAPDYLINYNAYQAALSQADLAIKAREAELAIKKAQARPADVDLARADITTAEGQVQAAQSKYEDTIIRAPADGTVTSIDVKIGELASALKEVIILQDISNVYLEANINEANVANVSIGMPVDINFDAFGIDKTFKGSITKINPSSTLVSGVVSYKVTSSIEQFKDIRPGMTANMTINVKDKPHIIAVPARSIITDKAGKKTIRVITNSKTKTFKEVEISTGLEGDGGMIEVTKGLKIGDEFVVLIKTS
ncbi:MAG: efflux RND transporter periplasmic adaptor subunit [Patescibacteria group bacterium]